jgi:hypothetical protein
MSLQKTSIPMSFGMGLDTKTDPKQVQIGRFLDLQNSVFTKGGLLSKRYGNQKLATLPTNNSTFLCTFKSNLLAIGSEVDSYSSATMGWTNNGFIQPVELDTMALVRSATNQIQVDSAISSNGLVCTVFTDSVTVSGSAVSQYKYVVADLLTGQNIISPTALTPASGTITGSPRVFVLGTYFVMIYTNTVASVPHLQYIALSVNSPTTATSPVDITTAYTPASTVNWDAVVANNSLYVAWNGNGGGGEIKITYIDSTLTQHNTVTLTGHTATVMSVTADTTGTTPVIWVTYFGSAANTGYTIAVSSILTTILAQTLFTSTAGCVNLATTAQNNIVTIIYEQTNAYTYDSGIQTHFLNKKTVTSAGTVSGVTVPVRSVGLASKGVLVGTVMYFVGVYSSTNQPSYFLLDSMGRIVGKLAYSNGYGYYVLGLPSLQLIGTTLSVPYIVKEMVQPVNKDQGVANVNGVYAQTGLSLAQFTIGTSNISVGEIGQNLNISGGITWAYDGYSIVEQGFHVWPDSVELTIATSGGSMTTQNYYYQAIYEWSDNQGNLFRSAPSIPVLAASGSFTGSSNKVTVNVPTLRLTYKTSNPVKIVIYRWSTAQQTYYQVTSIAVPLLNDTTVDSVSYIDTAADSSIVGNSIIYTTGGVVENIGPPGFSGLTLYKSRLMGIDAEDKNLLWYSKQVIENTPVEMSDLFTKYIAPTTAAQGSTGDMTAVSAMDDKCIIFKRNAIYYFVGDGPDNTGANNDFSESVFITSTVGCTNQRSIVFMPDGLMFQSSKGIYILKRNLSTEYIGAPVEAYNSYTVLSAVNVPDTNQVRFTLSNGITLMYDYYYGQWGTFTNIPAIASTIYQNLHTYINSYGLTYQESPGLYMDGSQPVLMSFKTSWLNLGGIQGFQRAYELIFIGQYLSPHKIAMSIAYDYAPGPSQQNTITPEQTSTFYGDDPLYGSNNYGSIVSLEQWKISFQRQKCQAFQIWMQESFDSSQGVSAGAGLTLSQLSLTVGVKGQTPKLKPSLSTG